ncbi:hypothetical protein [Natrinema gari]|uniref:Uncharacterized protein n=1 Tax=Natrinema gari JCM 14663 TaxID=1230459 RepID=L9YTI8_9EURY|nr:hypothetical protein [Natrinema gari]ELY77449.1 hypothetical protein C486_15134 [Natrinema gari JCM 14663]
MVMSTESAWGKIAEECVREYQDAVVYGDRQQEVVLHDGALRLLMSGWVELPSGRLLSPDAVHHVDPAQE